MANQKDPILKSIKRGGCPSIWPLFFLIILLGCKKQIDFYTLPTMVGGNTINAIVEIPAGTNTKYEYDSTLKKFVIDKENGKDRRIDFLPYPANYGFIPSTLAKNELGGDGDAIDILVIAESLPMGSVVESIPIALLKLVDDGEMDYKIIAVPKNKSLRVIQAISFDELFTKYKKLLEIIELWFLNYNPKDVSSLKGWGDEKDAMKEIKQYSINNAQ